MQDKEDNELNINSTKALFYAYNKWVRNDKNGQTIAVPLNVLSKKEISCFNKLHAQQLYLLIKSDADGEVLDEFNIPLSEFLTLQHLLLDKMKIIQEGILSFSIEQDTISLYDFQKAFDRIYNACNKAAIECGKGIGILKSDFIITNVRKGCISFETVIQIVCAVTPLIPFFYDRISSYLNSHNSNNSGNQQPPININIVNHGNMKIVLNSNGDDDENNSDADHDGDDGSKDE